MTPETAEKTKKKPRPPRIPRGEIKDQIGLRIYPSDRVKVSKRFGSVQEYLDHVLESEPELTDEEKG